eukprot:s1362_g2.t1
MIPAALRIVLQTPYPLPATLMAIFALQLLGQRYTKVIHSRLNGGGPSGESLLNRVWKLVIRPPPVAEERRRYTRLELCGQFGNRFRVGGNMVVSRTNYEITNEPHARRVGYRDWGYGGLQFGSFEVV